MSMYPSNIPVTKIINTTIAIAIATSVALPFSGNIIIRLMWQYIHITTLLSVSDCQQTCKERPSLCIIDNSSKTTVLALKGHIPFKNYFITK